jgi:hypothetical protein
MLLKRLSLCPRSFASFAVYGRWVKCNRAGFLASLVVIALIVSWIGLKQAALAQNPLGAPIPQQPKAEQPPIAEKPRATVQQSVSTPAKASATQLTDPVPLTPAFRQTSAPAFDP